jgi:hypothetical protein
VSIVVLLILAVVWAVFLIPQAVRFRTEQRPGDSIGAFHRQLSVLGRTTPSATAHPIRPVYAPAVARPVRRPTARHSAIRRRRRQILQGMLVAMGGTLLLGLTPWFRSLLAVHVLVDLLFVAYLVLLVRARNVAEERRVKVRFLPAGPPEPALLLRRSAN